MGSVPGFVGGVEPVRPRAGLDDVSVEGESVDDGSGEPGVGEGGAPFGEGGIGGAGDRGFLLARSDDLEQQFGAAGVEPDVSDFVEAEQIQMGVAGHDPGQLSVVGGLDQLIGQGGGGDVADPASLFSGGGAQGDEQMGFPSARVTEQDQRFSLVDPAAGGEVAQGRLRQVGQQGGVEVGQPFGARKYGLVDPPEPAAGVAFVAFGGEYVGEERLVGEPLLDGRVGHRDRFGADGR